MNEYELNARLPRLWSLNFVEGDLYQLQTQDFLASSKILYNIFLSPSLQPFRPDVCWEIYLPLNKTSYLACQSRANYELKRSLAPSLSAASLSSFQPPFHQTNGRQFFPKWIVARALLQGSCLSFEGGGAWRSASSSYLGVFKFIATIYSLPVLAYPP